MLSRIWMVPALILGLQPGARADTIARGTPIVVRVDREIDLHIWNVGQSYPAHVARDVWASNGNLEFPQGSEAKVVARETSAHRVTLELELVTVNEGHYVVDSTETPGTFSADTRQIRPYSTLTFRLLEPIRVQR